MVTFSESFMAFLYAESDKGSRVASLICNARRLADFYPVYKHILTDQEVNYITMRPDGMVSYLPHGKEHRTNERGEWARDGRQSGKAGKVIRKVFSEKVLRFIPAKEFEMFGNAYKAKFLDNGFQFHLKENLSVKAIYGMRRAAGEAGLNGSCMNGDTEYMDIYEKCESLRILILVNKDNLLCGRALVWNVQHAEHGSITFMDRIYVCEDYMFDLFLNHARENGWWRKVMYKSMEQKMNWINPTTDGSETMVIKIKTPTDFDQYPYIDTFQHGGEGYITNDNRGDYCYSDTGGTREGDDRFEEEEDNHDGETWDELREEYISEDDAVYLSEHSRNRRHRGIYTHYSDCVEARIPGYSNHREWFISDDENICSVDGEYYHVDHSEIVYRADGEYDLLDNCVLCETDNEYYESDSDELIQTNDGEYRHKENDDDVIYVNALDNEDGGEYFYHPDIEGDVVKEVTTDQWYYVEDKRVKRIEFHTGARCQQVWARKIDLLKWRNKIYHKDDSRIEDKQVTRKAYPTL